MESSATDKNKVPAAQGDNGENNQLTDAYTVNEKVV
jgi:hypothetical protein